MQSAVALHALAQLDHVRAAHARVAKKRERQARLGADRVRRFKLGDLRVGPSVETFGSAPQAFDLECRVGGDVPCGLGPDEELAQSLEPTICGLGKLGLLVADLTEMPLLHKGER